jgi:hypothetical protein
MDMEQSYRWLEFGDFKRETGSTIVAAEDQTDNTNAGYVNNMKKPLTAQPQDAPVWRRMST